MDVLICLCVDMLWYQYLVILVLVHKYTKLYMFCNTTEPYSSGNREMKETITPLTIISKGPAPLKLSIYCIKYSTVIVTLLFTKLSLSLITSSSYNLYLTHNQYSYSKVISHNLQNRPHHRELTWVQNNTSHEMHTYLNFKMEAVRELVLSAIIRG